MSRTRKQKGTSSLVSIRTASLNRQPHIPGSNALVQLAIQLAFMMLFTFALTSFLLISLSIPLNVFRNLLTIVLTFSVCFLFVRSKNTIRIVLGAITVILLLIWFFPNSSPAQWFIKILGDMARQVSEWFYAVRRGTGLEGLDYSVVSQLIVAATSVIFFTWSGLSTAPFVMGILASVAYGVSEFLAGETAGVQLKIFYFLSMLVVLRFLAQGKNSRSTGLTMRVMSEGSQKLGSGQTVRRNWAVVAACLVMAFVVLFDIALPDNIFYNYGLDQSISKMVGRRYGKGNQPITIIEFSLRALGFQPLESRLGGVATPDPNAYLTIETDGSPVWLKGASSIKYTGQGWITDSMNPNWMFNHSSATDMQNLIIGVPHSSGESTMNQAARNVRLTIYPEKPQQAVFHGGRPVGFAHTDSRAAFNCYFNRSGTFYLDEPIPDEGYIVSGQAILPIFVETEPLLRAFQDEYKSTTGSELFLPYDERVAYTELPVLSNLEEDVRDFDQALHRLVFVRTNAYSDLDVIEGIRQTLSTKLTYSLVAGIPERDDEFVGWFLKEGKGYCTFFATATTVLARCAGIPARYVEGFLVPATAPGHKTTQTLTGELAHAWCEVWVDHAGWVPIDSTPRGRLDTMVRTDYMYGHVRPGETAPTEPAQTDPPEPSEVKPKPPKPTQEIEQPPVIDEGIKLLRLILYMSPLWGYLVWRGIVYRKRHSDARHVRIKKRLGHDRFVQYIVGDIFAMWKLEGRVRQPYESVRSYISRVERARYDLFPQDLTACLERSLYAPKESQPLQDEEQIKNLLDFYREEEVYLRSSVEFKTWFFRRWLTSSREHC